MCILFISALERNPIISAISINANNEFELYINGNWDKFIINMKTIILNNWIYIASYSELKNKKYYRWYHVSQFKSHDEFRFLCRIVNINKMMRK